YYLCILLYHVSSPKSIQHLRMVNGQPHKTYKSACSALGLLDDDQEFDLCPNEASTFHLAQAMRQLFIALLVHNQPVAPTSLFQR
ncbi:hypothetical protein BCR39DRAFT_454557, partial [Naematelia encephala]